MAKKRNIGKVLSTFFIVCFFLLLAAGEYFLYIYSADKATLNAICKRIVREELKDKYYDKYGLEFTFYNYTRRNEIIEGTASDGTNEFYVTYNIKKDLIEDDYEDVDYFATGDPDRNLVPIH